MTCNKCCSNDKCSNIFYNLKKFFTCCYNNNELEEDKSNLSNNDFNKKRTPSLSEFVVPSYLNTTPGKSKIQSNDIGISKSQMHSVEEDCKKSDN